MPEAKIKTGKRRMPRIQFSVFMIMNINKQGNPLPSKKICHGTGCRNAIVTDPKFS
jgi:hypothetical protein